jgi:hypothetical protein
MMIKIKKNNTEKCTCESKRGLLKVTTESYYEPYTNDEDELKNLAEEWFDKYGGSSHAYRDGSKLPYVNLVKVEIVKKK